MKSFDIISKTEVTTSVTSTMNLQKTDVDVYGIVLTDTPEEKVTEVIDEDGVVYTSPDGSVEIIVDENWVVTKTNAETVAVWTNVEDLQLSTEFGDPYIQSVNTVIKYIKANYDMARIAQANIVAPLDNN